jgi:hypothetical protein
MYYILAPIMADNHNIETFSMWMTYDERVYVPMMRMKSILGLVMVIISGKLVAKHFRQRNIKYAGRKVLIFCIIFFYSFPSLTEQIYYLDYRNQTGSDKANKYSLKGTI